MVCSACDRQWVHPITFQICRRIVLLPNVFYGLCPRWKCEINPSDSVRVLSVVSGFCQPALTGSSLPLPVLSPLSLSPSFLLPSSCLFTQLPSKSVASSHLRFNLSSVCLHNKLISSGVEGTHAHTHTEFNRVGGTSRTVDTSAQLQHQRKSRSSLINTHTHTLQSCATPPPSPPGSCNENSPGGGVGLGHAC